MVFLRLIFFQQLDQVELIVIVSHIGLWGEKHCLLDARNNGTDLIEHAVEDVIALAINVGLVRHTGAFSIHRNSPNDRFHRTN